MATSAQHRLQDLPIVQATVTLHLLAQCLLQSASAIRDSTAQMAEIAPDALRIHTAMAGIRFLRVQQVFILWHNRQTSPSAPALQTPIYLATSVSAAKA